MTIRFMDGFDQFDRQDKLTDVLKTAGYEAEGNAAIVEGRTPIAHALQFEGRIKRIVQSRDPRVVIGFAYKATSAREPIVSIKDVCTLDWQKTVAIGGHLGEAIPLIRLWYYYELVIDKTAKTIQVYINNELDLTVPLPESAAFVTSFEIEWASTAESGSKHLDDFIVIDGQGDNVKDRVGPVSLSMRLPQTDAVTEFSPSKEGPLANMVNATPPTEGNYIQSNTSGAVATFISNADPGKGDVIAVGVVVRARKSDIDKRQMGMMVGTKEQRIEQIQTQLETTPTYSYATFERAPDGSAWTAATVQNTPFGVVVRP